MSALTFAEAASKLSGHHRRLANPEWTRAADKWYAIQIERNADRRVEVLHGPVRGISSDYKSFHERDYNGSISFGASVGRAHGEKRADARIATPDELSGFLAAANATRDVR